MGGGNAQKSATARDRNNLKKAKEAKNNGAAKAKSQADRTAVQCKTCLQTFMVNVKDSALQEHINAKHAAKTFAECFPTRGAAAAPSAAATAPKYKPDKPLQEKKKAVRKRG